MTEAYCGHCGRDASEPCPCPEHGASYIVARSDADGHYVIVDGSYSEPASVPSRAACAARYERGGVPC